MEHKKKAIYLSFKKESYKNLQITKFKFLSDSAFQSNKC